MTTTAVGLVATAGFLASVGPVSARAGEPLTTWLDGLATAAEAQRAGDFDAAEAAARAALAARPRGPAGGRARLALGLALEARGRLDDAASVLGHAALSVDSPALVVAALLHRGEALFRAGHPAAAAPLLAQVAAGSGPLAARARWREADALLEAGATAQAAAAYERLLAGEPSSISAPAARLALASAYRSLGAPERAVAEYRRLWLELPSDPAGRAAGRELRRWREAGGPVPEATPEERLEHAERLLALSLPRRVLQSLDRVDAARPPQPIAAQSALMRAMALQQLGRHAEADRIARDLLARSDVPGDLVPGAQLVLARASAHAGRADEASAWYGKLAAARPPVPIPGMPSPQRHNLPEDAAYLASWIYYDAGQFVRARDLLSRYARAHARSRRAEDARWFAAWSAYRLGDAEGARRQLATLSRGPLRAASLYWRARLARARSEAISLYRAAFADTDSGWYALMAASRLAELGLRPPAPPASPAAQPLPDPPVDGDAAQAFSRAMALLSLGLREETLSELRAISERREMRSHAALLAQLADAAGDPEIPFRMARDHLLPTRRALRWGHPEAYADVVFESARGFGVDPYLLLAVMRRESSFRERARSSAAAEGLLQLIAPTAERLATVLGVSGDLAERLGEVEVSTRYGAYYLGLLTARFQNHAVVLAAYNAGPAAAGAWARQRAGRPLDEWVEDIPFRETRHYVKIVTADYALYRRLYGARKLRLRASEPVRAPPAGVAF